MPQLKGRRRRLDMGPTRTLQTRVSEEDHSGFHVVAAEARVSISELLAEFVQTHPVLIQAYRAAASSGMSLSEYLEALILSAEPDDHHKSAWMPSERTGAPSALRTPAAVA